MQSMNWLSMNRTHLQEAFTNIWDFLFTNEQTMMSKGIHIRFYI